MCDNGYTLSFNTKGCEIEKNTTKELVTKGSTTDSVVYHPSEINGQDCFIIQREESWLWHKRLGHINFNDLVRDMVRDMPQIKKPPSTSCKPCHEGQQKKTKFHIKEYSTTKTLDLIHVDLVGPMRTKSLQGDRYFIMPTDDYSRMSWIGFLRDKLDAFQKFKAFKALVENKTSRTIKCLRLKKGGKFTSGRYKEYCAKQGSTESIQLLGLLGKMKWRTGTTRLFRR